jgi:hypothetical protein
MRSDFLKAIGIVFNGEIETPLTSHPVLPEISRLVVLLGMKRRMMKIPGKKVYLLDECLLHSRLRLRELCYRMLGERHPRLVILVSSRGFLVPI